MANDSQAAKRSLLPWKPNDWSLNGWSTGQPHNLFDAFGFRGLGLTYPKLSAKIAPQASAAATGAEGSAGKATAIVPASGNVQTYARNLLAQFGWSGQWQSFNSIVNSESGWDAQSKNGTSGAYGIAQALGHGDSASQGTQSNNYGGYGLSDAQAKQANSGDPYTQLLWMMNYIKQRYGSPDSAWSFHLANGWY